MLTGLSKLFRVTIPIGPDIWLIILLGIVGLTFLITLFVGLFGGEFARVKSLMKQAIASPNSALGIMKRMPVAIKKQYKHARMTNAEPSMFVTEQLCVDMPYKRSLLSKVWLATFVATVACAFFGMGIAPIAPAEKTAEVVLSSNLIILTVFMSGGLLTLIGALVARGVYGGARKVYAAFVPAMDGEKQVSDVGAQPQAEATSFDRTSEPSPVSAQYMGAEQAPETSYVEADASEYAMGGDQVDVAEPIVEPMTAEQPRQDYYAEPVAEPVIEPVVERNDEQEQMRLAREQAMAQAQAAREAQAAAQAQAQAMAAQQAAAQAQAQAMSQAQAMAAQQAAAQAQAQAAQAQSPSSADDIIARIEKIDREGAPRETMREVATLLQKERAKPENKTPEQQKKLNEALSKLLKAMSSATRK